MDTYYLRLVRSMLLDAHKAMSKAQEYAYQAKMPDDRTRRIIKLIRTELDDVAYCLENYEGQN